MSDETGHAADTDEVLIEALGRGATQAEASKLAGCAVRTVARRLDDPQFVRRVDVFRDALLEAGAAKLGDLIGLATSTLRELLADDVPPQIRLGSAKTVLDASLKLRDSLLIEKRLTALETRVSSSKSSDDE